MPEQNPPAQPNNPSAVDAKIHEIFINSTSREPEYHSGFQVLAGPNEVVFRLDPRGMDTATYEAVKARLQEQGIAMEIKPGGVIEISAGENGANLNKFVESVRRTDKALHDKAYDDYLLNNGDAIEVPYNEYDTIDIPYQEDAPHTQDFSQSDTRDNHDAHAQGHDGNTKAKYDPNDPWQFIESQNSAEMNQAHKQFQNAKAIRDGAPSPHPDLYLEPTPPSNKKLPTDRYRQAEGTLYEAAVGNEISKGLGFRDNNTDGLHVVDGKHVYDMEINSNRELRNLEKALKHLGIGYEVEVANGKTIVHIPGGPDNENLKKFADHVRNEERNLFLKGDDRIVTEMKGENKGDAPLSIPRPELGEALTEAVQHPPEPGSPSTRPVNRNEAAVEQHHETARPQEHTPPAPAEHTHTQQNPAHVETPHQQPHAAAPAPHAIPAAPTHTQQKPSHVETPHGHNHVGRGGAVAGFATAVQSFQQAQTLGGKVVAGIEIAGAAVDVAGSFADNVKGTGPAATALKGAGKHAGAIGTAIMITEGAIEVGREYDPSKTVTENAKNMLNKAGEVDANIALNIPTSGLAGGAGGVYYNYIKNEVSSDAAKIGSAIGAELAGKGTGKGAIVGAATDAAKHYVDANVEAFKATTPGQLVTGMMDTQATYAQEDARFKADTKKCENIASMKYRFEDRLPKNSQGEVDLSDPKTVEAMRELLKQELAEAKGKIEGRGWSYAKNAVSLGYWGDSTASEQARRDAKTYENALAELDTYHAKSVEHKNNLAAIKKHAAFQELDTNRDGNLTVQEVREGYEKASDSKKLEMAELLQKNAPELWNQIKQQQAGDNAVTQSSNTNMNTTRVAKGPEQRAH